MRSLFDLSAENAKIEDWLVEQSGFELLDRFWNFQTQLSVMVSEQLGEQAGQLCSTLPTPSRAPCDSR
jgi:hypothetical protein